jgi:2-aminoadipate transaminase
MITSSLTLEKLFAARTHTVHKSFVREILKVTERPEVISFAGGLPNPRFFPVQPLAEAAARVFEEGGPEALQYRSTEGYRPLREYLAQRYHTRLGLEVAPDEIVITTGSQQALDLLGKVFLDEGDGVALERPGYLGAIQAFGIYQPQFHPLPLHEEGVEVEALRRTLAQPRTKLFYSVPNFQNPSGISYSEETRQAVAEACGETGKVAIEDDPYGELRFRGEPKQSLRHYLDDAVLLGSFSKIVSPGMRLGWVCARRAILEKVIVAKQATDLHSNALCQRIVYQYLVHNDIDAHIRTIRTAYGRQCETMLAAIAAHCPEEVTYTRPEGGMFLWMTLPAGASSLALFERALAREVAFVPGCPFYVDGGGEDTLRLNFSNADEEMIVTGIARLGAAMKEMLAK